MKEAGLRGALLGLILFVVLLGAGGRTLWIWLDRPIERVSIGGDLHYVSAAYLQRNLAPLVSGETWLSIDLDQVRDKARDIDWLSEVKVSREWPDALRFELFEQTPVAHWNDDKLLNTHGEPFSPGPVDDFDKPLPDLAGPKGSGPEVLAYLDSLLRRLETLDLRVTQLRLEDRGAWRFQVNDSVWVILGRTDLASRLARFTAAWQRQLGTQASQIRYIDLRYPNGVSVAWHGQTEIDATE
ncbi:cell division protein FtsQ/DivIB [Chromohalobacter canadensis]|uniref:Cell division protein FtsQ n=1 Tax=Chromohalobacter canadensis TaxID=141389 RepID=A0ABZ0YBW9_9GAMM|nr:cell division protein FtsQ/DivIB [Chromohalobacter canadensis]MCK0769137.1 cell division protein FtsQ/DivIB [Chromohalobacter canadensis]WQH09426.1 cell division protein FtsQ/DivIB [Chromohalobacter canadensis]